MTRIRVVIPVVVEGDKVVCTLTQTAKIRLAGIVEMVIGECAVLGVALEVKCAVALCLVGITAGLAIEEVNIMYPYHLVLCVYADAVVHTEHDTEVAQLYTRCVTDEEAEAPDGSIITDTLDGDVHLAIFLLPLNLQTFARTAECIHV